MISLLLAAALVLPPQKSDAVIGVTAIHLESGRRVSVRGTERFPMGSVYKFPIGLTVLKRVDSGTLSLDRPIIVEPKEFAGGWSPLRDEAHGKPVTRTVGELLELMVSRSDNTASDVLLRLVGGPVAVTTRMAELNAAAVRVDRSEKQIHKELEAEDGTARYTRDVRDTSTPDAMAELLVAFWNKRDGLTPASHALLMQHMIDSPTGERKLRAGVPKGWTVAHKSGMMPATSNDVGVLTSPDGKTHIAIAIFAKAATSDYPTIDADVAAITRTAIEALAP
ncbi:MAG TPA: class A beta-lactamase [Thermoanaerobaculia bacterium]|jgi:beta-lactamase class A